MMGVHTFVGNIFAEVVHQMAVIVQQAGGHHGRVFAIMAGKGGTLKGVLRFGHVFAVMAVATFAKGAENLVDDLIGMHNGLDLGEFQMISDYLKR
jgi:hypothetical protein